MLCIWHQFRGHYRCMVTVLVNIRTPKHSSDQCRLMFIVFDFCQWLDYNVVGCYGSRISSGASRDPW